MTDLDLNPHDLRLYRRTVTLGAKQLATIEARVAGDESRWKNFLFTDRNRRLKKLLLKILSNKQRRLGEDAALREVLADLKKIEVDENAWQAVGKEELDYVQMVLHGLQVGVADENGRLLDDVA